MEHSDLFSKYEHRLHDITAATYDLAAEFKTWQHDPSGYLDILMFEYAGAQTIQLFLDKMSALHDTSYIQTGGDYEQMPDICKHTSFYKGFYLSAVFSNRLMGDRFDAAMHTQLNDVFVNITEFADGDNLEVGECIEQLGASSYLYNLTPGNEKGQQEIGQLTNPITSLIDSVSDTLYTDTVDKNFFKTGFGLGRMLYNMHQYTVDTTFNSLMQPLETDHETFQ